MQENIRQAGNIKITVIILLSFVSILYSQGKYKIVTDEEAHKPMLVGVAGVEPLLSDTSFSNWFNKEYEEYRINNSDLGNLVNNNPNFDVTIVMGTWCSDSRREVPRFVKILDTLKYPVNKIKMIYVNREKKDLEGAADSLSIKLVPTIIIYSDNKELGRITEAPEETLEKDLQTIVESKK